MSWSCVQYGHDWGQRTGSDGRPEVYCIRCGATP